MEDSVLLEEKDINVFNRLNKEANEKSEEFKADELFYLLNDYRGWVNALKPYIQGRIDTFRQMEEDFLNWNDTMGEIGIRYMVCRFIAKELEDIINKVEGTAKYIAEEKQKEKERRRKKHG